MQDRVPLYPGRVTLTPVSGQANTFDLVRADQPTQEGTPLNKASLLNDATAALYGLPNTAVPDDVLSKIKPLIDSANANANTKARIATGSYTGTGTYGSSNPNSLTFDFVPKFIWLYGQMHNERWGHLNYNLGYCTVVATDTLTTDFVGNRGFYQVGDYNTMYAKKSADGKNVQWYVTQNAAGQYNASGYTYYYLAIG